ncbi:MULTISPECIES: zinc-binding dehydrogenase [unclassified Microcoleus]|uniref:zinc-binding dehydrogenase n=1 Tax=unclassified Microcoleus TaxID=2642155 RepID=UPI00403EF7C7
MRCSRVTRLRQQVIDYKTAPFKQTVSGVDMVLDTVGGETQRRSRKVFRRGLVYQILTNNFLSFGCF